MVAAGTGEALPGPAACGIVLPEVSGPITGVEPGSGLRAGWASEAAICTDRADRTTEPAVREGPLLRSCVTHREGLVSATSWLGPPSRTTSENYSERSTGRP